MRLMIVVVLMVMVGCSTVPVVSDLEKHETVMKDACRELVVSNKSWCCCNVNGNLCCNWTWSCPWSIPGCMCN